MDMTTWTDQKLLTKSLRKIRWRSLKNTKSQTQMSSFRKIFAIVKSQIALKNIVIAIGGAKVATKNVIAPNAVTTNSVMSNKMKKCRVKNQKKKSRKMSDIYLIFRKKIILILKSKQ